MNVSVLQDELVMANFILFFGSNETFCNNNVNEQKTLNSLDLRSLVYSHL